MAIWADFTKYVRSILFKNELKNGNFSVSHATSADKANTANAAGEASSANFAFEAQKLQVIEGEGKVGRKLLWEASGAGDYVPEGEPLEIILQNAIDRSVALNLEPFVSFEYRYQRVFSDSSTSVIFGRTPPIALIATPANDSYFKYPVGVLLGNEDIMTIKRRYTGYEGDAPQEYTVACNYASRAQGTKTFLQILRVYQEF